MRIAGVRSSLPLVAIVRTDAHETPAADDEQERGSRRPLLDERGSLRRTLARGLPHLGQRSAGPGPASLNLTTFRI
jgi:hypothetical protein